MLAANRSASVRSLRICPQDSWAEPCNTFSDRPQTQDTFAQALRDPSERDTHGVEVKPEALW